MSSLPKTYPVSSARSSILAHLDAWLARVVLVGVGYALVALVVVHLLRPDLDLLSQFVSEYAIGPFGLLVTSAFVALSVASAALVVGLTRALAPVGRSRVGLFLLGFWSLAALLAAIFPTDLVGTPDTFAGFIHDQAEALGLGALVFASVMLLDRWGHDPKWTRTTRLALASGVVALVSLELLAQMFAFDAPDFVKASLQRVLLAAALGWMFLTASYLRRLAAGHITVGVSIQKTAPMNAALLAHSRRTWRVPYTTITLARVAIIGVVYTTLVYIFLNVVRTDMNPLENYMSEYVHGPYGLLMTSTFFVMALASSALLLALHRTIAPVGRSWPGLTLMALYSGGLLMAGIFPINAPGEPFGPIAALHGFAGNIVFLNIPFAMLALVEAWRHDPTWARIARPALVLGVIIVAGSLFSDFAPHELNGLAQRWVLFTALAWQLLTAWWIYRLATEKQS